MRIFKSRYTCKHYSKPNKCRNIEYIVIHYTGNTASSENQCKYYSHCSRVVSVHYVCSEHIAWEVLDPNMIAFHVTGKRACRNETAIGVDLETCKVDQSTCSASDLDWYHTQGTLQNAAELVAYLMVKYNVSLDHVLRHYDVTKKQCPASMVGKKIRFNGLTGDDEWHRFKDMIQAEFNKDLKGLASYESGF